MPRIQQRRATAAEWQAANPVLASGELAYITDSKMVKIGDGSTAFNTLPFLCPLREGTPLRVLLSTQQISYVQAHGLGEVPKIIKLWLECVVANNGYAVGDIAEIFGTSNIVNADSVNVRIIRTVATAGVNIIPKTGGSSVAVTGSANWRFYVRTFA